ncbi:MAG: glycoside hydrolase, partial [Actinomycetota bacterium]|nr:glycoside hydrolase [Actinomycetota bacterium]
MAAGSTLLAGAIVSATPAAAAPPGSPVVIHVGQVTRQDVPSQPGSEPDTVTEPDVAVSPLNPNVAVAAAHDSRYADGGAVDISVAWTNDGGANWQHAPVQGITTAAGGAYNRASDPVVTFGPDGTAYLSVLLVDVTTCPTAVAVLRSTNGGQTWSPPSFVHQSSSCNYSDDKNWLVVDRTPTSPHYGRLYQFWTPFLSSGATSGSPQAVRWSDNQGQTRSETSYVTPTTHGTQNSQPMVLKNGMIVDTYYDYGAGGHAPDVTPGAVSDNPRLAAAAAAGASPAVVDATGPIYASGSSDGGKTW